MSPHAGGISSLQSFVNAPQEGHHQPMGIFFCFPSGPLGLAYALIIADRTFSSLQAAHIILRHIALNILWELQKGAGRISAGNTRECPGAM